MLFDFKAQLESENKFAEELAAEIERYERQMEGHSKDLSVSILHE